MTDYEKGYKDGMAGAALPNIIDNGDKIDGYAYSYKTDSDGVPYINIDCVRNMLDKVKDVQPMKHGRWIPQGDDMWLCSNCKENIIYSEHESDRTEKQRYCCRCGARMIKDGDE